MTRGDVVTVVASGDFGKPRPAVVIQSDVLNPAHPTFLVCLMTSTLRAAPSVRIDVTPSARNGLRQPTQIMVDKIQTVRRDKMGTVIGRLDEAAMAMLDRSLAFVIGFA
jgi:mRNA interferase MazF